MKSKISNRIVLIILILIGLFATAQIIKSDYQALRAEYFNQSGGNAQCFIHDLIN